MTSDYDRIITDLENALAANERLTRERDDARTEAEVMKQAGRVLEQQRNDALAQVGRLATDFNIVHSVSLRRDDEIDTLKALLRECLPAVEAASMEFGWEVQAEAEALLPRLRAALEDRDE